MLFCLKLFFCLKPFFKLTALSGFFCFEAIILNEYYFKEGAFSQEISSESKLASFFLSPCWSERLPCPHREEEPLEGTFQAPS